MQTETGDVDVRFFGINAPDEGECFFEEATGHLIDGLKDKQVTLEIAGTDQFGRTLAVVSLEERDVGADLVGRGLAIASTPEQGEGYLPEEDDAIAARIGLWSSDACGTGPIPDIGVAIDPFDETVTLLNNETTSIDLGGWTIRDESSRHRYRFPSGVHIGPGGTIVVGSEDPLWDPGGSNVWNNDGDMAMLLLPDGRVVDHVRYAP